jgi:orotate phosphoribosyltransferase
MAKINLRDINPRHFDNRRLNPEEILEWCEAENAYWAYEGEPSPEKPHAELTFGLCSDGYFNLPRILRYPNVAEILGRQLAKQLLYAGVGNVDWVVSSAYAAITFGHEVAKGLGAIFQSVEKDPTDPNQKRMLWQKMNIPADSRVLQVEELVNTTGTLDQVRQAVEKGNAEPVDFLFIVGALVLRPPKLLPRYGDKEIVALVKKEMRAFSPKECPYCKDGSPRYRPKTHWAELTGRDKEGR